uniref:Putative DNA repair protein n=1 Tax=viral metagenome TaxID=1070528 RepID=A0A6M3KR77_9ZZZZ
MPLKWTAVAGSDVYKNATPEIKTNIQNKYFDTYIKPAPGYKTEWEPTIRKNLFGEISEPLSFGDKIHKAVKLGENVVKGAMSFGLSSPQWIGALIKEQGETMEQGVTPEERGIVQALPAYGIFKTIKSLAAKTTNIDKDTANTGQHLIDVNKKFIEKHKILPSTGKGEQFAFDIGSGGASVLTSIGLTYLTKNPAAIAPMFGLMQKGMIYEEARTKGKAPAEASKISTMAGIPEWALEYLGLNIFINKLKGASTIPRILLRSGEQALQEGTQQFSEETITKLSGLRKENLQSILQKSGYAAVIGLITGAPAATIATIGENKGIIGDLRKNGLNDKEISEVMPVMEKVIQKQQEAAKPEVIKDLQAEAEDIDKLELPKDAEDIIRGELEKEIGKLPLEQKKEEAPASEVKQAETTQIEAPEATKEGIITDPAQVQEIKNSIAEGELILKSGKAVTGRKMSADELGAVQRSVDNAKTKIGENLQTPIVEGIPQDLIAEARKYKSAEEFVEGQLKEKYGIKYLDPELYDNRTDFVRDVEKFNPYEGGFKMDVATKQIDSAFKIWGDKDPSKSVREIDVNKIDLVEMPLGYEMDTAKDVTEPIDAIYYPEEERYHLVDGRHRLAQAKFNKQKTILAKVEGETPKSQLTDIWNKAHTPTQAPKEGGASQEEKVSRAEQLSDEAIKKYQGKQGFTQFDDIATEQYGKKFSELNTTEKRKILSQKTGTDIIAPEEEVLKLAKSYDGLSEKDRESLLSSKYDEMSDGRYLIIDKKVAKEVKNTIKQKLIKDKIKENRITAPYNTKLKMAEKDIKEIDNLDGPKTDEIIANAKKVNKPLMYVGMQSGDPTNLIIYSDGEQHYFFDINRFKFLRDKFPNATLKADAPNKPVGFFDKTTGELKAILLGMDRSETELPHPAIDNKTKKVYTLSERQAAYESEENYQNNIREVIDDLSHIRKADDTRTAPATLSEGLSRISKELQSRGFIDFRGYDVSDTQDLAEVVATFRHPKLEQFQFIFTKQGKILAHQIFTSGIPNRLYISLRMEQEALLLAKKIGADSIYTAHNHPSGKSVPSNEDLEHTASMKKTLGQIFKGEIVTNHDTYSKIDVDEFGQKTSVTENKYKIIKEDYRKDFQQLTPIQKVDDLIAQIGKDIFNKNRVSIVFLDSSLKILSVDSINRQAQIEQYIREQKNRYGAIRYIIAYEGGGHIESIKQFPEGLVDIINLKDNKYYSFALGDRFLKGTKQTIEEEAIPSYSKQLMDKQREYKINLLNNSKWDSVRQFIEDDWLRVKKLIQQEGANVTETNNPYEAEIRYWGRLGARTEEADQIISDIDKDILATSKKLIMSDTLLNKEINRFLVARHTPERNEQHGEKAAGITTEEAKKTQEEITKKRYGAEVIRIADRIQELNSKTLDILLEGEVISQELYDKLRAMYKNHIPLNRVMSDEDDIVEVLTKRGFDVRGTGLKRAKGSELEVADILTNVVANYKAALIRSEKNIVDNYTLRFSRENEYFDGLFEEIKPKAVGKTFGGRIILEQIKDPKVLPVREKGNQVYLKINDPQLAMALRGVNRQKVDGLMRGVKAFTRFYSGLMTRFNPEFVVSNKVRDLQEVAVYLVSKNEIGFKGTAEAIIKDPRSVRDVTDAMRGKDTEGARLYRQMKMDGGTTGGMALSTRGQLEINLERIRAINRNAPRKAAQIILQSIDMWNTIFEDSSRLSVYRQALKQGVSRNKAAVFAKEASVNFNKMGTGSPVINALYMFSNASVQGTAKMLRAMRNPKVLGTVLTLLGGAIYLINEYNDRKEKDWRKKISKWDRLNGLNIIISTDKGLQYVTIPISWGLKPIKVFFDELGDLASGHETSISKAISGLVASTIEAYNPAGGTDVVSAITPSILDLPVDIARNRSWTGGKIRPDWNNSAPDSIKYFDSLRKKYSGRKFIEATKELGEKGLEISPADANYAYEQLIGGTGRSVTKLLNTIVGVAQGKVETKEIPFVSRFYRDIPEDQIREFGKDYNDLRKIIRQQDKNRFYLNQEAELAWDGLKQIPIENRKANYLNIKRINPMLAEKIKDVANEEQIGLNYNDRLIKKLGVENGERSKYLWNKIKDIKTIEDRKVFYKEMKDKNIITDEVDRQIRIRAKRK